jgi:hypothetical protein
MIMKVAMMNGISKEDGRGMSRWIPERGSSIGEE